MSPLACLAQCCADEVNLKSDLSCTELRSHPAFFGSLRKDPAGNLINPWNDVKSGVCAASLMPFDSRGGLLPAGDNQATSPRCQRTFLYREAEAVCFVAGARLCTRSEVIENGLTTGCGLDSVNCVKPLMRATGACPSPLVPTPPRHPAAAVARARVFDHGPRLLPASCCLVRRMLSAVHLARWRMALWDGVP
jgi:hypothetical protein